MKLHHIANQEQLLTLTFHAFLHHPVTKKYNTSRKFKVEYLSKRKNSHIPG